jgi:hypothetical protein
MKRLLIQVFEKHLALLFSQGWVWLQKFENLKSRIMRWGQVLNDVEWVSKMLLKTTRLSSVYPYLKPSRLLSVIWSLNPWSLVLSCMRIWEPDSEKTPLLRPGWDKIIYSGQVLRTTRTRFNAQPLNKVVHLMHKVQTNYSSCSARSSENICSSSGGTQEIWKIGWNSV